MALQWLYILLSFLLCFYSPSSLSAILPSKPHALLLKVTKDPSTSQYITEIKQRTPLVPVKLTIDLDRDLVWMTSKGYISSTYKPIHCNSSLCISLEPFLSIECKEYHYGTSPRPGFNNHTCSLTTGMYNRMGELGKDVFTIQSTDGSNPGQYVTLRILLTCSSEMDSIKGLAKGVKGMAGFSKSPNGFLFQLTHAFRLPRIWSLCLSSSTGFAVIGDGPYNVLPGINLSQSLTYTPLITSTADWNDHEYFINVTGIKVNNKRVQVDTELLKLNIDGEGGTKISTMLPYTVLEGSVYKAITKAFITALSKIPRVKPVAPFEVCYKSSSFASTLLGPQVPLIEFVLHRENVSWKIYGINSMVLVKGNVLCLGFVNGGINPPQNTIVIGGYQLENAFLQFDLSRSRLGFASTIIGRKTTCSNFNFTSNVL